MSRELLQCEVIVLISLHFDTALMSTLLPLHAWAGCGTIGPLLGDRLVVGQLTLDQ